MTQDQGYRWEEVGARIRDVRKGAGKTQKEVGATLGVSSHTVWCWEAGKTQPTPEHITKLAQAFGVSTDWLLGKDDVISDLLSEVDLSFRQAVAELPVEDIDSIRSFIQFVRERRRERLGP